MSNITNVDGEETTITQDADSVAGSQQQNEFDGPIMWDNVEEDEEGIENATLAESETDLSHYEPWEKTLQDMHKRLWDTDGQTRLLQFTESETPEFVKDRIRDALLSDVIFSDIDSIRASQRDQLREFMLETLTSDGWTVDELSDQIEQLGVNPERADTIARTETASVLNRSREIGYQEKGQGDDMFYWSGALDSRTTEACQWLINKTNPFEGGNPVRLNELKELIEEAPEHDDDMQDDLARPNDFVVHPQERKSFVRAPPDMV